MSAIAKPKKPAAPREPEISDEAMDLIADLILDYFETQDAAATTAEGMPRSPTGGDCAPPPPHFSPGGFR